jgi:hypothetical protein
MDIDRIWANENQLHALTGLTTVEAQDLLFAFQEALTQQESDKRSAGGRPPKLNMKSAFVMLMMFFRHYITLEAVGALFDLDDSNVKRRIDQAQKTLRLILKKKNFSHLIVANQKRLSRKPLNSREKSILTALNSLSADQKEM